MNLQLFDNIQTGSYSKKTYNPDYYKDYSRRRRSDPTFREAEKKRNNERNRKKYHSDSVFRNKQKAYSKQKIRQNKIMVMYHYSKGTPECSCCGEKHLDFLTIDHINGGGRKQRNQIDRPGSSFYGWLIKNNYPDGYRVLCMNCNLAYGILGYCPHEKERSYVR